MRLEFFAASSRLYAYSKVYRSTESSWCFNVSHIGMNLHSSSCLCCFRANVNDTLGSIVRQQTMNTRWQSTFIASTQIIKLLSHFYSERLVDREDWQTHRDSVCRQTNWNNRALDSVTIITSLWWDVINMSSAAELAGEIEKKKQIIKITKNKIKRLKGKFQWTRPADVATDNFHTFLECVTQLLEPLTRSSTVWKFHHHRIIAALPRPDSLVPPHRVRFFAKIKSSNFIRFVRHFSLYFPF